MAMQKAKLTQLDSKLKTRLRDKMKKQKTTIACPSCGRKMGTWTLSSIHNRRMSCKNKKCRQGVLVDASDFMQVIKDVEKI